MTQLNNTALPKMSEREKRNAALARQAAAEGIVLLENNGVLPLTKNHKIALYGAGAKDTVFCGSGSGEVHPRYVKSIEEGLVEYGFDVMDHNRIDAKTDTAIFVLSRASREGVDRRLEKGDYYLTEEEELILSQITSIYTHVIVVLNVGGIVDLSFLEQYPISALLLTGYGGMEGGSALAQVLSGDYNPSGRLTDTWAYHYEDYPCHEKTLRKESNPYEKYYTEGIYVGYRYFDSFGVDVRYPFGYGLSYTTFSHEVERITERAGMVYVRVAITNTGSLPGADVMQLYISKPWGLRKKELKQLVGFKKTKVLKPGEGTRVVIEFPLYHFAAWHTGESRYIYDQGSAFILLGHSCMDVESIGSLHFSAVFRMEKLNSICPLQDALKEIVPPQKLHDDMRLKWRQEAQGKPRLEITETRMADLTDHSNEILDWDDLAVDDFQLAPMTIRRMTREEKLRTVIGHIQEKASDQESGTRELAPGAVGETTHSLSHLDLDTFAIADGPAGLSLAPRYEREGDDRVYYQFPTVFPCATVLAQSFNTQMLRQIGKAISEEMREYNVQLWLAPGMNLHRDPLCGRNFEYFSEDPVLSGICAARISKWVQRDRTEGVVIKHFACYNREDHRREYSSIISERALREMYLKSFEICIRQAQPKAIMTASNKINGVHCANSYDLCTEILRKEWEFDGVVITSWNTTNDGGGCSAARCIASGNDLVMPGRETDYLEVKDALEGTGDFLLEEDKLNASVLRILSLLSMR